MDSLPVAPKAQRRRALQALLVAQAPNITLLHQPSRRLVLQAQDIPALLLALAAPTLLRLLNLAMGPLVRDLRRQLALPLRRQRQSLNLSHQAMHLLVLPL